MSEEIKNNPTETKKEKTTIKIKERPVFKGGMKTDITTSIEIADFCNAMFAAAMHDFMGCKISINTGTDVVVANSGLPAGALYVDLYFRDNGKSTGAIKNLINIYEKPEVKNEKLGDRLMRVAGNMNSASVYKVTPETYEMIEDFMPNGSRTNWALHTTETTRNVDPILRSREEIIVKITGLDLNKIISYIYGSKTDEGVFDYIATPSTMIPATNGEFILQVAQLNMATVRELQEALGGRKGSDFHIYTR